MCADGSHNLRVAVADQTGHLARGPVQHALARCCVDVDALCRSDDVGMKVGAIGQKCFVSIFFHFGFIDASVEVCHFQIWAGVSCWSVYCPGVVGLGNMKLEARVTDLAKLLSAAESLRIQFWTSVIAM